MTDPSFLLLDEPVEGLPPVVVKVLAEQIVTGCTEQPYKRMANETVFGLTFLSGDGPV